MSTDTRSFIGDRTDSCRCGAVVAPAAVVVQPPYPTRYHYEHCGPAWWNEGEGVMGTEIAPNAPLLLKTLEHIENHPEEWTQGEWGCGTTGCFAFHSALIGGGRVLVDHYFIAEEDDDPRLLVPFTAGNVISVRYRARRVLGLTEDEAERLFDGGNTLNDLRAEVYRLAGDAGRLAEVTEVAATNAINRDEVTLFSAYAHPDLDLDASFQRWCDLKSAIREWQAAEDGEVDLDTLEPQWRDAEVYTNHLRGLVDDAVHKLIGRPA